MNYLGEDIKAGDVLVFNESENQIIAEITDGFGMSAEASGSALYGKLVDGRTEDMRYYRKVRRATEAEAEAYKTERPFATEARLMANVNRAQKLHEQAKNELKAFRDNYLF